LGSKFAGVREKMNFKNVKVPKGPGGGVIAAVVIGGLSLYGATHTLYNVDGGHRAIVFNRLVGIKDKVSPCKNWFLLNLYIDNESCGCDI